MRIKKIIGWFMSMGILVYIMFSYMLNNNFLMAFIVMALIYLFDDKYDVFDDCGKPKLVKNTNYKTIPEPQ